MKFKIMISLLVLCMTGSVVSADTLPKYKNWTKSKKKVEADKSSLFYGVHYIYADKKAVAGYKKGNAFAEGSTIVVENFDLKGADNTGKKNMIVMMKKDKKSSETGGWRFSAFSPNGKQTPMDTKATCFGCHQESASGRDFVISTSKDFKGL